MQVKLNKIVAMLYSILAVALSLPPLFFIFKQDTFRLGIFVIAYVITAILALKLKERSLPLVALMAFLLGWLKTSWSGFDIDPGSGLLVLAAGIFIFGLTRKVELKINLAELMLLVIAGIALVSMLFTLVKIASFSPVPGLGYMNYSVNSFGLASDDLIIQVTRVTSVIFSLFGLLVAGRRFSFEKDRFLLFSSVSILVLINSGILFYQKFVDSAFLSPVGIPFDGRFSGATSFCYALSSGVEILILSIPLWFIIKNKWLAASSTLVGALLLYSLNLSGSRTALFVSAGFLLCWGYYAFMQQVKGKSVSQKIAINLGIFVILGAIVTGVYLAIPEDTSSSLGRLKVYSSQEGGFFGHLIDTRLEHYRVSIPMVLERPLAGIGLGTYYSEARKYADLNIENYNPWDAYGVSSNVSNILPWNGC